MHFFVNLVLPHHWEGVVLSYFRKISRILSLLLRDQRKLSFHSSVTTLMQIGSLWFTIVATLKCCVNIKLYFFNVSLHKFKQIIVIFMGVSWIAKNELGYESGAFLYCNTYTVDLLSRGSHCHSYHVTWVLIIKTVVIAVYLSCNRK